MTPGTFVGIGELSDRSAGPEAIEVTHGSDTLYLKSLDQLRFFVRIKTSSQALHFVRLRTPRYYGNCWPDNAQEIVSVEQLRKPEFADTEQDAKTASQNEKGSRGSGLYAVISANAYKLGKFQPPVVALTREGFTITRWICTMSHMDGKTVEKWRETVDEDGAYRRVVLASRPVPKLPGTRWGVMGRL